MKKINLFLLSALAFLAGAGLQAQVTIGGVAYPTAGAILDLNSGAKGGLVLSSVAITSLDSIPEGTDYFPGVNTSALRGSNPKLRGAIVYNINPATVPGVYVWTGHRWMPIGETEKDQILFTIHTEDGNYAIPISGYLNQSGHAYDWDITIDGLPAAGGVNGYFSGTGATDSDGIPLTGLSSGDHQIRITPHGDEEPGWGNAFGYYLTGGANVGTNKAKLISIDAPLSTLAFAPKTTGPESANATAAYYMFAYMFHGCTNLTTTAVIWNNYKLPETITDLSFFLCQTHYNNTNLEQPIDLTPLRNWFTDGQSITVSYFLAQTHSGNTNLKLESQIIFPNWVKTIKQGETHIREVIDTFYRTFYLSSSKTGDTGEPQFEDRTVLSSIGEPSTNNRQTYTNRAITPVNNNWK